MPRVAVFIDWQNAYKSARAAFGLENMPNERGNFSPFALASILAAGNGRGPDGKLVRVEIHRGIPSNKRDPTGYGANRRQATAWVREAPEIIKPCLRPLAYRDKLGRLPVEKGIDVQLALSALENVLLKRCDTAIIFSHDTDLAPAIELIARLRGPGAVETVSWRSHQFRSRLRPVPGVHHHEVSGLVFQRVETPVNYAYNGGGSN